MKKKKSSGKVNAIFTGDGKCKQLLVIFVRKKLNMRQDAS